MNKLTDGGVKDSGWMTNELWMVGYNRWIMNGWMDRWIFS